MSGQPRVGLFVTCLVDLFRPVVGFSAVKLLRDAGCQVEVPAAQTCCGQPAYNSGDRDDARAVAVQVIKAFADVDYVVAPSGSCAAMLRRHYPGLFAEDDVLRPQAEVLAEKTYELLSFLTDVLGLDAPPSCPPRVLRPRSPITTPVPAARAGGENPAAAAAGGAAWGDPDRTRRQRSVLRFRRHLLR